MTKLHVCMSDTGDAEVLLRNDIHTTAMVISKCLVSSVFAGIFNSTFMHTCN